MWQMVMWVLENGTTPTEVVIEDYKGSNVWELIEKYAGDAYYSTKKFEENGSEYVKANIYDDDFSLDDQIFFKKVS